MLYKLIKSDEVNVGVDKYNIPINPVIKQENDADKDSPQVEEKPMLHEAKGQSATIIEKANTEAKSRLEEAKKKAEHLLKEAQESGFKKGFEKGCQEGYEAGSKKAKEEYEELLKNARELISNAHIESRQYIKKTEDEIVGLAASIAESIIKYSIDTRDESIIEMIKTALQRAEEMRMILFRCSSDTILMLKASEHEFKRICPNAVFSFIEDKSVNNMGCIIETEEQVLDLEIDNQLKKITDALKEMRDDYGP